MAMGNPQSEKIFKPKPEKGVESHRKENKKGYCV